MTEVKTNFKSQYQNLDCDLCKNDSLQSDLHLLDCVAIQSECSDLRNDIFSEYEDIFGPISQQILVEKLYLKVFQTKNKIESK